MKKLIRDTYKHFIGFLLIQSVVTYFIDYNMEIGGQLLLSTVLCFVANFGLIEITQKALGGKNSKKEMVYDSLAASLGGIVAVLLVNIFLL